MKANRREFIKTASLAATALTASQSVGALGLATDQASPTARPNSYKYRIAFGCWINDMRGSPLPLQQWPAPQLDEETVASAIRAMDVQSRAGFNYLDAWGLFATYGYPPDITSAFADKDRRAQVRRIIAAAAERGMKYVFGLGLFSWGYDAIIKADPAVQGRNKLGQPLEHAMCGAREKAWRYVEKIVDIALSEFDFCGVHLESADMGWCGCPECGSKDGTVAYNIRLNTRMADYIKRKWPGKIVTCIPISWLDDAGRPTFNDAEQARIIELSRHIDCFMDQGWTGTYIADTRRKDFIQRLHCDYGTSGGMWVYHSVRWDRCSYFLPYPKRTSAAIQRHFADGARACMFYQGPMVNPGVELNTAVGGRILSDTRRTVDDVLGEVAELYYRPKTSTARRKLVDLIFRAEEAYFGLWDPDRFQPGMSRELHLTNLFGVTPGPASYLLEPYLTANGRRTYQKELVAILSELTDIGDSFDDHGRLQRIQKGIIFTLNLVETIGRAKGES
jgi:hypothetical protein